MEALTSGPGRMELPFTEMGMAGAGSVEEQELSFGNIRFEVQS